jgi:hypothetical protein
MSRPVKYKEMLNEVTSVLAALPEHRTGENKQYELRDAGLSAFSVFYMQSPSFLSWQQDMERRKKRNNARSLFGIKQIPGVEQIRNLLDGVEEEALGGAFWGIYRLLKKRGQLTGYGGVKGTELVSLDGTQHHASQQVHCEQCRVKVRKDKAYYEHQVLLAVLCGPEQKHVLCLEPEFITPQDGHDKQDCEQAAIKRWVQRHGDEFTPWGVTILGDDLHCHQPTCEALIEQEMYFIFTCKPDSHTTLYEELTLLKQVEGAIGHKRERHWNGRFYERWEFYWAQDLPLRRGQDALMVNWCEWSVYNEKTGKRLYRNAWATNHTVTADTVVDVARSGRSRWKVENEGINVLKNQGYRFEHNYGHGEQHLANVLLCCLLLAFLVHTVLDRCSEIYQAIRASLGARRKFFNDLQALTRYIYFSSWQQLMTYMVQGLELDSG